MRVLFIHPHFPGHFALLAYYLTQRGWDCTYLTSTSAESYRMPYRTATYRLPGRDPQAPYKHPSSLAENLEHMAAVAAAARELKERHGFVPQLVVGHLGTGTLLYLKTLFDCRFLGYFDYL